MTTRPTWPVLTSQTGLSRATIGRVLLRLRRAGLLGVVASGRSAGCQTVESLHGQGDAAVYVLAVPSPLQAVAPVDESETPSAPLPVVDEPMRARETANDSSEPLRGPHPWPADAGAVQLELADRTVVRLPGRSTRALRLERRKAQAGQVASRVPILATLSTSYVAAILRDFALAGWTTSDLVEAIDWRPDGTRCAPGEEGELVHRGALVAQGYWGDPERTAERFRPVPGPYDAWRVPEMAVWSGDTVVADEEGFLYFVGRHDEMIKTSGYRVSPAEIEEAAYATGMVRDAVA
ncbi:MAG: AMP-binding protein, partial [Cellulomonas sp.]|nr:AMP-binding protein [Cellulomonas sp.]